MQITILNVDDNTASRYMRAQVLRQAGYNVIEAVNGRDAIAMASEVHVSLVLLDVNLPDISGLDVCRAIKNNPDTAALPVLHISATAVAEQDLITGLQAADAYLIEPVPPEVLLAFVRAVLRGRELLQQWVSIFDALSDGVALLSAEGRILRCNSAFCRMTGKRLSDVLGHTIAEVVSDPAAGLSELPFARSRATGQSETIERRFGDRIYRISSHLALVRGNVAGAVYIISDVTAEKQADQEKQDAFALLHALTEAAPIGFAFFDRDMRYRLVNKELADLNGVPAENHLGRTPEEIAPSVAAQARAVFNKVLETGQPVLDYEFVGDTGQAPGHIRNWSQNWYPVRSSDGHLLGVGATVVETTEHKRMQRALRESEARYRLVARATNDVMWDWDLTTGRIEWNDAIQTVFGYRDAEAIKSSSWRNRHIHPEDLERVEQEINAAISDTGAEHWTAEYRFQRADGSYAYVLDRGFILRRHDSPIRMVGSMLDLTRQRETEERLRLTNAALARSNEQLQRFAYVVAHDLQSPMRSIGAFSQLLVREYGPKLDDEGRKMAGTITASVGRTSKLISDLLEYCRLTTETPPSRVVDCNEALQWAVMNLQALITETGATITSDPLPTVTAGDQLPRVFQNVIENGIKYRCERGPEIHVSAQRNGNAWEIAIRDNGIGLDMQYADRIFEAFQRLHGQEQYEGSGLGLATCRKVIESYGGRMWVNSEPGKGSTFYFTLPAVEQARAAASSREPDSDTLLSRMQEGREETSSDAGRYRQ